MYTEYSCLRTHSGVRNWPTIGLFTFMMLALCAASFHTVTHYARGGQAPSRVVAAPRVRHTVALRATAQEKPISSAALQTAASGIAAAAAGAWISQLPTSPEGYAILGDAGAWVSSPLTLAIAALTLGTMVTTVVKIATAPPDVIPIEVPSKGGFFGLLKKKVEPWKPQVTETAQKVLRRELAADTPMWKIRLELMKPVTWAPLICGVACGAAASGNFHWWNPLTMGQVGHVPFAEAAVDFAKVSLAMFMSGPLLTGYTQTINDWYDRDIDAINEPYRAIPSGRISGPQVIAQIWALLLAGVAVAAGLDYWAGHWFDGVSGIFLGGLQIPPIFANAIFGSWVAYVYSAPPLKLKQSGWIGDYACGASYIALPWWCGQSLFGVLTPATMVLPVLYSFAGLGIAIVNDFKSVEGDRVKGLQSLTVMYGIERAKWICAGTIDITQLAVALYLSYLGETNFALVLLGLVLLQMVAQEKYLLKDPVKYDVKYQISALPFFTTGILCTALAMAHHQQMLTAI